MPLPLHTWGCAVPAAGLRLGSLLEATGSLKSPAVRRLAVVGSSLFPCVRSTVMWAWVLQTSSWTDPQAGSWSGFLDGTRCVGRGWVTAKALPLGDTPRHVSHSMAGGFPDSRAGQHCGVSLRQLFPAPVGQCRSIQGWVQLWSCRPMWSGWVCRFTYTYLCGFLSQGSPRMSDLSTM